MAYTHVKTWRQRVKSCLLAAFEGRCGTCGYDACDQALELHHLDANSKDFAVSNWDEASYGRIAEEASKCVLLCSNCHREVHSGVRFLPETIPRFDPNRFDQRRSEIQLGVKHRAATSQKHHSQQRANWSLVDVLALRSQQKSWKHIAGLAGVSVNSAIKRYQKLGGPTHVPISWPEDATLSRLVWEKPVAAIARDLGVSGVAVKKRCFRRQIQTPPRGYWSRRHSQSS